MALDTNGINLLKFAAASKPLGKVATLGRQALYVRKEKVRKLLNLPRTIDYGPYCEDLIIRQLGASSVESFDNSDYEKATHIVDMNVPLTAEYSFDTVVDLGTIEHVYNAPQALKNVSQMCAEGGQILHMLPANNYCGHGFWQFSPELFSSLYSEANGYAETRVFLLDITNEYYWYEARHPLNGARAELTSFSQLFVLVRTRKMRSFSHQQVQQSSYVHLWNKEDYTPWWIEPDSFVASLRKVVARIPLAPEARSAMRQLRKAFPLKTGISARHPYLTKRRVSDLITV